MKKWGNFVRRLSRLLYKSTLHYLIIDFIVEKGLVEKQTFAQIHKLDSAKQIQEIQAALNMLTKHGLLTDIEMRLDKFKSEYAIKIGLQPDEVKFEGTSTKVHVYYFHVDLKFILKARLYRLARQFDEKISKNRQ